MTFNDLTYREDYGRIDQAVETISEASKKGAIHSKTQIEFHCFEIPTTRIVEIFNPDVELHDLTKNTALSLLEKRKSLAEKELPVPLSNTKISLSSIQEKLPFGKQKPKK